MIQSLSFGLKSTNRLWEVFRIENFSKTLVIFLIEGLIGKILLLKTSNARLGSF